MPAASARRDLGSIPPGVAPPPVVPHWRAPCAAGPCAERQRAAAPPLYTQLSSPPAPREKQRPRALPNLLPHLCSKPQQSPTPLTVLFAEPVLPSSCTLLLARSPMRAERAAQAAPVAVSRSAPRLFPSHAPASMIFLPSPSVSQVSMCNNARQWLRAGEDAAGPPSAAGRFPTPGAGQRAGHAHASSAACLSRRSCSCCRRSGAAALGSRRRSVAAAPAGGGGIEHRKLVFVLLGQAVHAMGNRVEAVRRQRLAKRHRDDAQDVCESGQRLRGRAGWGKKRKGGVWLMHRWRAGTWPRARKVVHALCR